MTGVQTCALPILHKTDCTPCGSLAACSIRVCSYTIPPLQTDYLPLHLQGRGTRSLLAGLFGGFLDALPGPWARCADPVKLQAEGALGSGLCRPVCELCVVKECPSGVRSLSWLWSGGRTVRVSVASVCCDRDSRRAARNHGRQDNCPFFLVKRFLIWLPGAAM